MMRQVRHPLVARDLIGIVEHIVATTEGDFKAAFRRLDEIDALLCDIAANQTSGTRLAAPLEDWLVRHGGRGRRLTVVFRADLDHDILHVAFVTFGGQDWVSLGAQRQGS